MTWVGYFEDIEERHIEALERDGRHLQIVASNATLNESERKHCCEYSKCHLKVAQKMERIVLEIVTHPDYSNVFLVAENKKLKNELSDCNRDILALREEINRRGQEKDRLRSKLQNRVQENIQLVSQIKNLEKDITICRKESDQFRNSINLKSSVSKQQTRKKSTKK